MYFKNLYYFAFTRAFETTQEQMEAALSEIKFTSCASTELSHFGFVPALGDQSTPLCHQANGNLLFCARREDKIMPPATIKERVAQGVKHIQDHHGRKATKKERELFKAELHSLGDDSAAVKVTNQKLISR